MRRNQLGEYYLEVRGYKSSSVACILENIVSHRPRVSLVGAYCAIAEMRWENDITSLTNEVIDAAEGD